MITPILLTGIIKMFEYLRKQMIKAEQAHPGRDEETPVSEVHYVNGNSMKGPFANDMKLAMFGMGCFWGAERGFWLTPGVFSTAAGYAGGFTKNPTYEEVCSGRTGHNEVVRIVYDSRQIDYEELLRIFWESHNPTQGMQQGDDRGTQYRSGIYCSDEGQYKQAASSMEQYQMKLNEAGFGKITTEIIMAPAFYFAEDYHQQYLAKNPAGYCGLGGTGVSL